jgi:hypothetical protein
MDGITVAQLIVELNRIPDKTKVVYAYDDGRKPLTSVDVLDDCVDLNVGEE